MSTIPNLEVPNITGYTLRVEAFHVSPTYAGVLEGLPNDERNAAEVAACRRQIERLYGQGRPVHVLPPAISMKRGHPHLPPVTCWAWLTSNQPVRNTHQDGSHLFLLWFTESDPSRSLQDMIADASRDLAWTSVAQDFSI